MPNLRVQIVRYVEAFQPGIVNYQFRNADGQVHSIIGELPCFTAANLWFDSEYPQAGEVNCRVLRPPVSGTLRNTLGEEKTDRSAVCPVSTSLGRLQHGPDNDPARRELL